MAETAAPRAPNPERDTAAPARPGSALGRVRLFLDTIRFEHSVFALPFALLSAFLVADGAPGWGPLLWLAVAMVGARTLGMAANRVIDAEIDARNPRTAGRALPAGLIAVRDVWLYMAVALGVFGLAVSQLEPLAWYLSPVVVAALVLYPYAKRFTWLSHMALGGVYLIIPPAAWIAVSGELTPGIAVMGVGAAFWVAGFDVIYATADIEVDRAQGLHSIPARFGLGPALWTARLMHAVTVAALLAAGALIGVSALYYAGVAAVAALLAYEHSLVSPGDLSRLGAAFFTMNGVIAVVFAAFVIAGTLVG